MIHFIVIGAVIVTIILLQSVCFYSTKRKIEVFSSIFRSLKLDTEKRVLERQINNADSKTLRNMLNTAGHPDDFNIIVKDEYGNPEMIGIDKNEARLFLVANIQARGIKSSGAHNPVYLSIEKSINDYLNNNKTNNDFHLLKDIVDRNCDAKEDEISTQIPIPLYLGLMGTMLGILIGVGYLWLSGGLNDLLSTLGETAVAGIEGLMGGVALAMGASIFGIVFTTVGSYRFKKAKSEFESSKHEFLNWIQVNLLPTLSDNLTGVFRELTTNLEGFNEKFANNTSDLGEALSKVNESYNLQVALLDSVTKLADKDVSYQNLQLYEALSKSTGQIRTLTEYLSSCNEYLTKVKALNDNLDLQEKRTRVLEDVGIFFRDMEANSKKLVGKIDISLQESLKTMQENAEKSLLALQKITVKQNELIGQKSAELGKIITEIGKLGEVKSAVSGFEKAISHQNEKIDKLAEAIRTLAAVKTNPSAASAPSKNRSVREILVLVGCMVAFFAVFVILRQTGWL